MVKCLLPEGTTFFGGIAAGKHSQGHCLPDVFLLMPALPLVSFIQLSAIVQEVFSGDIGLFFGQKFYREGKAVDGRIDVNLIAGEWISADQEYISEENSWKNQTEKTGGLMLDQTVVVNDNLNLAVRAGGVEVSGAFERLIYLS